MVLGKVFGWGYRAHLPAWLAGAMTSTPVLGARATPCAISASPSDQLAQSLDHLEPGYAPTYLAGLVSLIVGARYMPAAASGSADQRLQQIACERGLDTDSKRKSLPAPVIRAYRVGPELVAWADGKICANWVFYRQTGCYI